MMFVQSPCVLLKCTPNMPENHPHLSDEPHVEVGEIGRKEKKRSFWKWPVLRRKTEKYDLVQAAGDDQHEAGLYQKVSCQPIVTPVGPDVVPEARKEKKGFWKWPVLHHKTEKNDLEKKGFWKRFAHLLTSKPSNASTSEDPFPVPTAEQLEQDIPENGNILRHYKIGDKLGEGGFGFVYKATRRRDGLKVAVKCSVKTPQMKEITVPGYDKPLPTEIGLTIMANNGPNVPQIIKLLDWEDNHDHYMMVMERPMPCMDLFRFIKHHGGHLDEKTGRHIMWQAIHAVSVCCDRGVFHRDIKLENILVNPDTMEVKLIDFGCGAIVNDSGYNVFSGTREYFPPEFQIYGRYHAKPTTVWSLGIVLFAMMCGALPSFADHYMIEDCRWTSPGLSQECCWMICGCLQPDPDERLALEQMHLHDWFKVME